MKNFLLTTAAILVFSVFGNAQKFTVSNNQTVILEKSGRMINIFKRQNVYAGFDGKNHYFIVNGKLLKTDETLKKTTAIELQQEFFDGVLINFYSEDVAGLICIEQNKNSVIVKKVIVDGNGLKETELKTLSIAKHDYYQINTAVSPDKKTKMIALTVISGKNDYKFTEIFVINNQGELRWSEQISPTFKNESLGFYDMCVGNDGSVYVLANSYTIKVKNCNLHLFKVNEEEGITKNITESFPFNTIGAMNIIALSNGNVFIGGIFTKESSFDYANDIDELGTFSYVFDAQSLEKQNFKSKFLPETTPKGLTLKEAYTNERGKTIKGIYETSNGNVTMLVEELVTIQGMQTPTMYCRGNVLIFGFDLDGNYKKSDILFKRQLSHNLNILNSFDVIVDNDKLVLIYNDNAKNDVTKNLPKPKQFVAYSYKKGQTVACIVKDGTVGKKQTLINAKEEKRIFYNMVEQLDNQVVIRIQTGMAAVGPLMLETITWQK
ncbi:MAG: hypothetical protein LBS50_11750 [Prevotellaceae bacterium]|jgi:hypothetical protein|nr:hypothetical protein [Prevotellaceae bacterium]